MKVKLIKYSGKFNLSYLRGLFRSPFKSDESKFVLMTSFKICLIPILTIFLISAVFYIILKLNLIFFEANGFIGHDRLADAYYEFILGKLYDFSLIFCGLIILLFFIGIYVSSLLLRPFKMIGQYCEDYTEDSKVSDYNPDFFSDLKVLTSFSEYFFNIVESGIKNKVLKPMEIPKKFTSIHKPVFEIGFFVHFFLFIIITSIISSILTKMFAFTIYDQLNALATQVLQNRPGIKYFIDSQGQIFEFIVLVTIAIQFILFVWLSFNLYSQVAAPAFGVFATMRSFIKGNFSSRIHIIGYYFLRDECRKINRYLDKIEKEIVTK